MLEVDEVASVSKLLLDYLYLMFAGSPHRLLRSDFGQ